MKTTDEIKSILVDAGGNVWETGTMHRVYFDQELIFKNAKFSFHRYNTGNIQSAELDGAGISNSEAKRILSAFAGVKFYYDLDAKKFCITDRYNNLTGYKYMASDFFKALEALLQ